MTEETIKMIVTSAPELTDTPSIHDSKTWKIFAKPENPRAGEEHREYPINLPPGASVQPFVESFSQLRIVSVPISWLGHATVRNDNDI